MNILKKILHNCTYFVALLGIWMFLTVGGLGLMIYRGYDDLKWQEFCENPVFAVIAKEEMRREAEPIKLAAVDIADKNIAPVTDVEILTASTGENLQEQAQSEMDSRTFLAQQISKTLDIQNRIQEEESKEEEKEEEKLPAGETVFVTYTPVETDSIYYYDVGKYALTTEYPYTTVEESYFDDAAFFGDSRTLGISDYAGLNSDFYCENGMTIYKLLKETGVMYQNERERVDLNQVLQQKKYGKIYMMLGMNELGYGNTEYFLEHYDTLLKQIQEWQPDAVIFLLANLHVSRDKNNVESEFNNININAKNAAIATLADGINVFYLDVNPLFTDSEGYLNGDITFDGVHLYANCYQGWKEFLMEHGVVR